MGLDGNVTIRWADVRQRNDGKFVLPMPTESNMVGVVGYLDAQDYDCGWFEISEISE